MAKTKIGSLFASIALKTDDLRKGINRANKLMGGLGRNAQTIGRSLAVGLGIPLTAIGAVATRTFKNFEQEMAKVNAISGATIDQFKELTAVARDLGATTRFTSTEVAGLQLNLSKLGLTPDQINEVTASILNLALATGEDLAESARVSASTMRGFALEAEDMGRITDVMAKSFSSSALDLEKFAVSMRNAQVVSRIAGLSLEETTAMIATLVDAGQDASKAGTDIRMVFLKLAQEGITLGDAFDQISQSADKLTTAEDLVGARASASLILLSESIPKLGQLTDKFNNAGGSAEYMAGIMDDTLNGSLLRLQSAVQSVQLEFGTLVEDKLRPIIDDLAVFIEANKEFIAQMIVVASKIGLVTLAVGGLIFVIGGVALAIVGLNAVIAMLIANPVVATVVGITLAVFALGSAMVYASSQIFGLKDTLDFIFNPLETTAQAFKALYQITVESFTAIGTVFYQLILSSIDFVEIFIGVFTPLLDVLQGIGLALEGAFTLDFEKVKEGAKKAGQGMLDALSLKDAREKGQEFVDNMLLGFGGASDIIQSDFKKLTREIKEDFVAIGDGEFVDEMLSSVEELEEKMSNIFKTMGSKDGEQTSIGEELFNSMVQNGKKALEALKSEFKVGFDDMKQMVARISDNMTDSLMEFFNTGKMNFRAFVTDILQQIQRLIIQRGIVNPLLNAIGGAIFGGVTTSGAGGAGNMGFTDLPKIDGFARNGGTVQAGNTYMVGEAGAELFVPRTSGTVIPNHQLGGGGVNVTFNVEATDAQSFDSQLGQRSNMIVGMIQEAMNRQGKAGIV